MSDTAVTPKESTLKRFAKAFYAKVQATKERIVALLGDNETPVADEGTARKIARLILSVPKWFGHGVVMGARLVLWAANAVVGLVTFAIAMVTVGLAAVFAIVTLSVYKTVQLLALIIRTPYLIARGGDCLRTDWVGYANLWRPKYFHFMTISQVFEAQGKAPVSLSVVVDRTKNEPTPKQHKTYPSRMPSLAGAEA